MFLITFANRLKDYFSCFQPTGEIVKVLSYSKENGNLILNYGDNKELCTQFAGLLAFAQNAQANLRRLSVDDRVALDEAFRERKPERYGLADALRVVNKAAEEQKALRAALEAESAKWAAEMAV